MSPRSIFNVDGENSSTLVLFVAISVIFIVVLTIHFYRYQILDWQNGYLSNGLTM